MTAPEVQSVWLTSVCLRLYKAVGGTIRCRFGRSVALCGDEHYFVVCGNRPTFSLLRMRSK